MLLGEIFGSQGLIVLVILLVVVFGGSQLPKLARNVGSAGREFRKAQAEAEAEEKAKEAAAEAGQLNAAPVTPPTPAPAPTPTPVVSTPTPAAAAAPAEDRVTLSKSELDALLDERIKRQQSSAN